MPFDREYADALDRLASDERLWGDFLALCDCGGRLAGTDSEKSAITLAAGLLAEIDPRGTRLEPVTYAGWTRHESRLKLADGTALACHALVGSQATAPGGLAAEVLDLGRGTPEQFEHAAARIAGRIVLVRHEYMFATGHIHRRRKYGWAMERGAAGFIIASPYAGTGTVTGSSGRGGGAGIPAVATDFESAARLAADGSRLQRAHLSVSGRDYAARTSVPMLEIRGATPAWVVLSAHIDGHDLAESAMDNASGVATAIAVARAFGPLIARCRRGLKVCLFSAEEWALAGSRQVLDRMTEAERSAVSLNINLDTVGGDCRLTALTSEFPMLEAFVRETAAESGTPVGTYPPLMTNSDHANFARQGIPALRLVAGFDAPQSHVRYVLTPADTRDKVAPAELRSAAQFTAALLWKALNADDAVVARLRER